MTTTNHSLTSDHLEAFRDHIDDYVSKTPFGLHINRDAQETPDSFWAYGFVYTEDHETYRKRCFRPCGSKKKHVVACRDGFQVVFAICKSTGKFTVGLRPVFESLA
jgi:hypothetical protein